MIALVVAGLVSAATVNSNPSIADILRAEKALEVELRGKKLGYPEFEKRRTDEVPVAIAKLRCSGGKCSYDLIVAGRQGKRSIRRPGSLFCKDPQEKWAPCVH